MWLVLGLLHLVAGYKMSKTECDTYMRQSYTQVTKIEECLTTHYDLNRLLVQIHEKMDQVEKKLKEALKTNQYSTKTQGKIDDILDLREGNQDCQRQQNMVQGLRRKLEWHNLMSDIDISQFEWPRPITRSEWRSSSNYGDPELKLFKKDRMESGALDNVQCLLKNGLQNSDVG